MPRSGRLRLTTMTDPAKVGPVLRDMGFVGSDGDPITVRASFDQAGKPRRIIANYAGGWRCDVRCRRDGSYSISQSISITFRSACKSEPTG